MFYDNLTKSIASVAQTVLLGEKKEKQPEAPKSEKPAAACVPVTVTLTYKHNEEQDYDLNAQEFLKGNGVHYTGSGTEGDELHTVSGEPTCCFDREEFNKAFTKWNKENKKAFTLTIRNADNSVNEGLNMPGSAQTAIYVDKEGDSPISDAEAGDKVQTDEAVCPRCHGSGEGRADGSICPECGGSGDSNDKYGRDEDDGHEEIEEGSTKHDVKPGDELNYKGRWCKVDEIDEHDDNFAWCSNEDGESIHVNLNAADKWTGGNPIPDREDHWDDVREEESVDEEGEACQVVKIEPEGEEHSEPDGDEEGTEININIEVPEETEEVTDEDIQEALSKSAPASEWINDFVKSKDPKFAGKSKEERIKMALGAYYSAQRNEEAEVTNEALEPLDNGKQKKFIAAHGEPKTNVVGERQTGTEAMDQKSKPKLPVGKTPKKAEDIDAEKENDQTIKDIKKTTPSKMKAPAANQVGAQKAEKLKDETKGGKQSAQAPKANGSTKPGAQKAEKIAKDVTKGGKQSAEAPKAGQKHVDPQPKGLKECIRGILMSEDAIEEGLYDTVKSKVAAVGKKIYDFDDDDETGWNTGQDPITKWSERKGKGRDPIFGIPAGHADGVDESSVDTENEEAIVAEEDVTEARMKVYMSDLEDKFGAKNSLSNGPGPEPFLVILDNGYDGSTFHGFKDAASAKGFVQAVNSVNKEADFVDGPEAVHGPFQIKKI